MFQSSTDRTSVSAPGGGATPSHVGPAGAATTPEGEYLTFRLGREEYAIEILRVQEIRSYEVPTRIANAPEFIKGVVNLRGVIVPIVDLRIKLTSGESGGEVRYDQFIVVIVLNVEGHVIGAVVDGVSDVLALSQGDIRPAPQMNTAVDTSFITGIASVGERMVILLDIVGLLSSDDIGLIRQAAAA